MAAGVVLGRDREASAAGDVHELVEGERMPRPATAVMKPGAWSDGTMAHLPMGGPYGVRMKVLADASAALPAQRSRC